MLFLDVLSNFCFITTIIKRIQINCPGPTLDPPWLDSKYGQGVDTIIKQTLKLNDPIISNYE